MSYDEREGLGWRFWGGLFGIALLVGLVLIVALILFGVVWYAWGLIAAFLVLVGLFLGANYIKDRRTRRQWAETE